MDQNEPPKSQRGRDPDAERVARARGGDARAFAELVAKLEGRIFRFLLRQVGNPTEAEDLAQDTFLEAFRKLDSFQGNSLFSTWVTGIALNLARNFRNRAPSRRYPTVGTDELEQMQSHTAGPHEQARSNAFGAAVIAVLDTLTDDLRDAINLVGVEGLSYEQAAETAGIPVGTMKTRVFRARRILRDEMTKRGTEGFLDAD